MNPSLVFTHEFQKEGWASLFPQYVLRREKTPQGQMIKNLLADQFSKSFTQLIPKNRVLNGFHSWFKKRVLILYLDLIIWVTNVIFHYSLGFEEW